jgi:hypothetical protein
MFGRRRREQEIQEEALRIAMKVALEKTNEVYDQILRRLIEQNKQLMDRLMAKDYQELKVYSNDGVVSEARRPALSPDEDELNAGEVLFE